MDALKGNKGLCRGNVGFKQCSEEKNDMNWFVILLPAFGVLLLLLIVAFGFWYTTYYQRKGNVTNELISTNKKVQAIWSYDGRVAYEKIIEATEESDSKYYIGFKTFGSVFKASLFDNQIVAVKKLHVSPDDKIFYTIGMEVYQRMPFETEIGILTEIRHRNIVKLHGFCSTSMHSFLVYEYLEVGSLKSLLSDNEIAARFGC